MNSQHKAIRALLSTMAPKRAVAYIKSFELPEDEEFFLIECDVRKKSYVQASMENNVSPEVIKSRKSRAYAHIADQINHGGA